MSKVQVDTIVDKDDISAPTLSKGAIVTGVCTATTFVGAVTGDVTGNADTATTATTATNAQGLTGTPNITVGNVISANVTNSKQTTSEHVNVTGVGTFGSDISVADNIVHTGNTNTAIKFADNSITLDSAGSLALHIDGSAKIGFGTNNPQKPVDVYGDSAGQLRVSNSSKSADLICDSTGGLLRTIGSYPLVFNTNQTDRLRIGTSGEIGLAVASGVSTDYGTSGQVLTSAGSGSAVQWADVSAGMWSTLASGEVTSGTTGTITNNGISSTYGMYKIVFYAVLSGEGQLGIDLTTDGGSTWSSSTGGWTLSSTGRESNSNMGYDDSSMDAGFILAYNRNSIWGDITFGDTQNTSTHPSFNYVGGIKRNINNHGATIITNMSWPTNTAFNGLRWYSLSANMTSVKWVLQGTTFS